jgi:hypothetical protein
MAIETKKKRTDARSSGSGSLFEDKAGGKRYQGCLTKRGSSAFEGARKRLAKLVGRDTASDGDTIEALAIGWDATSQYLAARGKLVE